MLAKKALLLLVIAVFVPNAGCTTIKPIERDARSSYAEHIVVGDKIRLLYLDGRVKEIRVVEINEQEVTGKMENGGVVIADWRDIYEAERIAISPLKTAGAALGILVAIPVIVVLGVMSGCLDTYC